MIIKPRSTSYPKNPGVYRMLDINKNIIYIGKAKNLNNRLKSYFDSSEKSFKTQKMVTHVDSIEITITDNENEALILEQKLINQIKPKYNIIFRDDKSYPFISFTKHKYPKIHIIREKDKDFKSENYFGPYSKKEDAVKNLEFIQKHFNIRTCTDNELAHRSRPCILHSIGKCSGPCVYQSQEETKNYRQSVSNAKKLLSGDTKSLVKELNKEMAHAAESMNYERAAALRDTISALKDLENPQKIYDPQQEDAVVFNMFEDKYIGYTEIIKGIPQKIYSEAITFAVKDNSPEEVMSSYVDKIMLTKSNKITVVLPFKINNFFFDCIDTNYTDKQKAWLRLVESNLELISGERSRGQEKEKGYILALQDIFLNSIQTIDFIDISHFSGEATYGGKIRWNAGSLEKEQYRLVKFEDNKVDDILHINQTVEKIYHSNVPNILIIDGDKPQMQAAYKALQKLGKDTILLCSAKGRERKRGQERFYIHPSSLQYINPEYIEEGELILGKMEILRNLFQYLQDKAHDFSNKARKQKMDKTRFSKK